MCIEDYDFPVHPEQLAAIAQDCLCSQCITYLLRYGLPLAPSGEPATARPMPAAPYLATAAPTGELRYLRNKVTELEARIAAVGLPASPRYKTGKQTSAAPAPYAPLERSGPLWKSPASNDKGGTT